MLEREAYQGDIYTQVGHPDPDINLDIHLDLNLDNVHVGGLLRGLHEIIPRAIEALLGAHLS